MGWFSKALYKETDLLSTIYDLRAWMGALDFRIEDMHDKFSDDDTKLLQRFRARRQQLELVVVWDGDVATFLQQHTMSSSLDFERYQRFHNQKRYFVLTYGGNTLIVKHSVFISNETPIIAASIGRVMEAWDNLDLSPLKQPQ